MRNSTGFVGRSPLTRDALEFAAARHEGQKRDHDDTPFVTHPVEVACLLHEAGYSDEVVAAGVLHDVLENTDAQVDDLKQRFGSEVTGLVAAVTDDPSIKDRAQRKAALREQVARAGECAAVIFAADKVSKTRELRARSQHGRLDRGAETRIEHYRASLEMLQTLIPEHQFVEQLRDELQRLQRQLVPS